MTQLGLGTAQFGMPYGVSNRQGQTPPAELVAILALASRAGIRVLDTAALYGNSESALGAALATKHPFRIVTKTPDFRALPDPARGAAELRKTFEHSLSSLRQPRVHGLLVHNASDLFGPGGDMIWREMEGLRSQGLVEKIGVSVYAGNQIDQILGAFAPDIVQLPVNVFDQRLVDSGHLAHLKSIGVEVHIRSIFLQGLLLMAQDQIPRYFDGFRSHITSYFDRLASAHIGKIEAALSYALSLRFTDVVLVGVACAAQLEEILRLVDSRAAQKIDFAQFASNDPDWIDPSRWQINSG